MLKYDSGQIHFETILVLRLKNEEKERKGGKNKRDHCE